MGQVRRTALAARVFTLTAIGSLVVLYGDTSLPGVGLAGGVALLAQLLTLSRRVPDAWVAVAEGAAISGLAVAMAPHASALVPYLAVPPLVGGLAGRVPGVLRVSGTEAAVLAGGSVLLGVPLHAPAVGQAALWLMTGVGLGCLGAATHRALSQTESATEASYRTALDLLRQLHALSGRLSEGLDAPGIADALLERSAALLPVRHGGLFVRAANGTVFPLRLLPGTTLDRLPDAERRALRAWRLGSVVQAGRHVSVPLRSNGETVAVLVVECVRTPDPTTVASLSRLLSRQTLRLSAALLFSRVRDAATSEERQRLAREVHDGVAQDVASLGYLVDTILPSSPEQADQLADLRAEVGRVVAELRHSIYDLRNEVNPGRSLGDALSAFAQHLGAHSPLTVHLTLDERPPRLQPEVEAELLRIAQEAMNNARKHAHASNLWVRCRVDAPRAEIEVRDDGRGLGPAGEGSHGLAIMRERADRVGATLRVTSGPPDHSGTCVHLTLTSPIDSEQTWPSTRPTQPAGSLPSPSFSSTTTS